MMSRRPSARPGTLRTAVVLALACLVGMGAAVAPRADAQSGADDVDVLTASREEVRAAVAELDARVETQAAAVAAAEADEAAARVAVDRAKARVALAHNDVELAREVVAEYAVEAYIRPPATEALRVLSISSADDATYASSVIRIMADERRKVVDVLVEKQAEADRQQQAADRAVAEADARANAAQEELAGLERMRDEQTSLAESLDDRLDQALAEAAALAEIDRQMSEELAAQELALRNEGPPSPVVNVASPTPDAPPATEPTPTSPPTGNPGTNAPPATRPPTATTRPPTPTTRPPTVTTRPPSPPSGTVTWADVTSVGGIWVHKSIASQVQALLNAGNAAGLNLRGGGFRDSAAQVATRRANCGPTYYDIYEKPSNQCSPPTARPGRSMHERGLAIDFTSNGALITSRSSAAFRWLQANASRYGLYNLPSEPWHWSTNGN